jgi:hypothetical protein
VSERPDLYTHPGFHPLGPRPEDLLAERLAPVVTRARTLRWLIGWAWLLAGAAVLAVGVRFLEERRGWQLGWLWGVALVVVGTAAWAIRQAALARADEGRLVARLIEQQQPELRALLLTAVAQGSDAASEGRLGYLQEQVVRQALDRVRPSALAGAVPRRRLQSLAAVSVGGGLALGYCLLTGFFSDLPSLFDDGFRVLVSPGDTQIERGGTVLVLARFAGKLPAEAELVVDVPGEETLRAPMRRSLEDPVWGALTPALARTARYHVEYAGATGRGGRSPSYRLAVFAMPEIARVDARIEYPGQAGVAAREISDARFLSVTEGARITVTVEVVAGAQVRDVALVGGEGEPAARERIPLRSAGGKRYVAVVTPARSRRYEVRATDGDGRGNEAPPRLSIDVHRNQPPELKLVFPGKDTRVSPLEEMTVEARISDDTAVLDYGVTYRLAGTPPHEVRLGAGAGTTVAARAVIALEALQAQPDQLLTYYFWAEDHDGAGKRRRTSSDMYFAEVQPFEQRFREAAGGGDDDQEGGAGAPLADLSRRQKEIVNATWKLERAARDAADVGPQAGASEAARELAEGLGRDLGVVATGQEELRKASEGLRARARETRTRAALEVAVGAMGEARGALERGSKAANETAGKDGRPAAAVLADITRALDAEQRAYAALLRLRDDETNVARGRGQGGGGGESPELAGLELKQKASRFETRRQAMPQRPQAAAREALGRLEELARRQKALSERLKEAEATRATRKDAEPEIERRLKRLREEQQALLEDLDQVRDRLARQAAEANGDPTGEPGARAGEASGAAGAGQQSARAELERTRAEAAAVAEALARGEAAGALGASSRAERALERARGDLAKDLAAGLGNELRELREAARALDERQQALAAGLGGAEGAGPGPPSTTDSPGARARMPEDAASPTEARRLAAELRQQKAEARKLLERVQAVSSEAEQAAPLLSRKLYEGLREAKTADLESALDLAGALFERNLGAEGRVAERRARTAIGDLRGRVNEATKGVLGDEAEALRAAQAELDGLLAEAERERAAGTAAAAAAGGAPAGGAANPGAAPPASSSAGDRGAGGAEGPITGGNYRGFAERLRDLQDLLDDGRLRNQAAGVGDRARALRADWNERGRRPSAALLEDQVLRPLAELRLRVGEQLDRLQRNDKLVPLDRDPIPSRYTDLVRRYWKSLSEGK